MSAAQTEALRLQYAIGAVFFILGGWCVVAPGSVIALVARPEFQSEQPLLLVTIGAFGAQAMLAGVFATFSRFTKWTFAAFGAAIVPFFVFDWWFYAVEPVFNELILLDAIGNTIFVAVCVRGWVVLRAP